MFAGIYDILMADVDYQALLEQFKPYLNHDKTMIDAGCGSGYFLKVLLENGYDAIGLDKDSDMLKIAKDKLHQAHLPQPLYIHDLRAPLHVSVDVIFCLFDVINYFKGIKKVFSHIYQALSDEGVFIFDVYHPEVMKTYDNYEESDHTPIPYHWQIAYQPPLLKHTVTVDQHTYETKQYVYDKSYYKDLLMDANFKNISVHEGIDNRKIYFIAYK